jgi:hypothetical protein
MFTSFTQPVDKAEMRRQRVQTIVPPDYRSKFNRHNNYGFNAAEQRRETFTGMGHDINVHDQFAVESMGRISDRTTEHLGQTDRAIATYRRMLIDAIDRAGNGERPLMVLEAGAARRITGPDTIDAVGPADGWDRYWQEACRKRRQTASWAALVPSI